MRVHVPALPWFTTEYKNSQCAYTNKVIRFADMLTSLGHEVIVYAGERSDTREAEVVTVFTDEDRERFPDITWSASDPVWREFNMGCIQAISERQQPGDILGIIGGNCQQPVTGRFPDMPVVEWGIGYEGTFAPFRVFESYAWMHTVLGSQKGASAANGNFYDAVIPNSFSLQEFPFSPVSDGYMLYIGRLIERKGLQVVADIAERSDRQLVIAGAGDESLIPKGTEYAGLVGPVERAKIMGGAAVTLVPTLYLEPFGGVAVESMMCGTPVVSTDWGAFTETVNNGVSGYRCRTLADFVKGVEMAADLPRPLVRQWSLQYDVNVVRHTYEKFLLDVAEVQWGKGWHT